MGERKRRKVLIQEKIAELKSKQIAYLELKPSSYHWVTYRILWENHSLVCALVVTLACLIFASLYYSSIKPILWGILAVAGLYFYLIYSENVDARRDIENGLGGKIIVCFYTQKVLDEIRQRIARTDELIALTKYERAEHAERKAKVEADRNSAALAEARRLQPDFEYLFDIIRNELDGQIQPAECADDNGKIYESETQVLLTMPVVDTARHTVNFEKFGVNLTELTKTDLMLRIALVRPVMKEFHVLQNDLNAALTK